MFWMREHFVEVRVTFRAVCRAGIRNAVPVLGSLQGICKRLLVLEVQMLILVWGFASSLLETVLFLMAIQGTLIGGFPVFDYNLEIHVYVYCLVLIRK